MTGLTVMAQDSKSATPTDGGRVRPGQRIWLHDRQLDELFERYFGDLW